MSYVEEVFFKEKITRQASAKQQAYKLNTAFQSLTISTSTSKHNVQVFKSTTKQSRGRYTRA